MRVLIDTNVLFSAALNPNGTPFQAYVKAVTPPNTGIICRQNIEELRRTFNRKLPHKIQALESFLAVSMRICDLIPSRLPFGSRFFRHFFLLTSAFLCRATYG